MEAKFKVGDSVRVLPNIKTIKGVLSLNKIMKEIFAGKGPFTISHVMKFRRHFEYHFEEDEDKWYWHERWIESYDSMVKDTSPEEIECILFGNGE